jgi:hypothetical protein
MATSFRNLVGTKNQSIYADSTGGETNLERGKIWSFTPGTDFAKNNACWIAPADGTVVLEIIGAGGSGARMCCCGGGLPGNAGAYAKKTFKVAQGQRICGCYGFACGNADAMCFRGCSEPSMVCYQSISGNGCMCAQGGKGGVTYCSTGTSMFCCFGGNGFCRTGPFNDNCGIVCNVCPGSFQAQAFGGDVNVCGHFSCVAFFGCQAPCICSFIQHVAVPGGSHARCGGVVVFATENNNDFSNWSGQGAHQHLSALNGLSKQPNGGIPWAYGWGFGGGCGCYENEGCSTHVPPGHPGTPAFPCPGVRDQGRRGGHGLIRIKFMEGQ